MARRRKSAGPKTFVAARALAPRFCRRDYAIHDAEIEDWQQMHQEKVIVAARHVSKSLRAIEDILDLPWFRRLCREQRKKNA